MFTTQGRAPLLRVNGHLKLEAKEGKNIGGSILASGVIMGTEFMKNLAAKFCFQSGILYNYEKSPYDILYPALCADLTRRELHKQFSWIFHKDRAKDDYPKFKKILEREKRNLENSQKWTQALNPKRAELSDWRTLEDYFPLDSIIEIETNESYSVLPQMEGSQGIAFTGAKQALIQGKIVGSKILISFKEGLTVQTVGRSGSVQAYQPIMALSLDSLLSVGKSDSTGKGTSLIPIAYPLEEELRGMTRLILGPKGSEKLPFALPSFLEGRALLEAFQKNIGYIPLTPECPDYLSLHRKMIQNGAALIPYLKPFLENPKLLGLPGDVSFEALIEKGISSLQKQTLPKEISLKLQEPVLFYGPQGKGNSQSLRTYVGTPLSYYDPHLQEHVAQIKGEEVYLMGDEASLTHFDQARLIADKGGVATGTLRLTKQIDCEIQKGKTSRYVPHLGGEVWVKQLELHGKHCENALGEVKSEVLWTDFETLSTTGVVQATTLIGDVGKVLVRREQRSWQETYTVETVTKKKKWTGRTKRKKKEEKHTITMTEAYPEDLSGLYEIGRVIKDPKEIELFFPEYEKGRVLESLSVHGGKLLAGPEGWSPEVTQKIELLPLITTSLKDFSAGCRGMSKTGMTPYYEIEPTKVISQGSIHVVSDHDIHFMGTAFEGNKGPALIEALGVLRIEDAQLMQPQAPFLYNQKRKIMELGGFKEVRLPTTMKVPGEVILRASGGIFGDRPEVSSSLICESDVIDLTRPEARDEMYDKCVGYRARGGQALAMIAGLAAGLLTMGTATPTVMATFLSVSSTAPVIGTIGSVAVGCVASQTASSLVMHGGNLKEVGKDLTSSRFAQSLIINMATAGTIHELSGPLKLPSQPKGWAQHLKVNAVRSLVSTPLHIVIEGCKPQEALVSGVTSCVAHTVGGVMSNNLGDLYGSGDLSYLVHKGGHFGTGFLLSLGLSGGDLQEALGGGLSALGAEVLAESLPKTLSLETRGTIAKIGGSLTSLLTNTDPGLSIFTASNAIDHNFLLQTARLARSLTPKVLAELGLSGISVHQVGQWLKDHPLMMDLLPEGILWEDSGFMPEKSQMKILTTPLYDGGPWQEGYQVFEDALPLAFVTPQAEDSLAYILTLDKKMAQKPLSMGEFKSDIFTQKIHWTSSVGTQQTYPVYQRSDIDWDMVRKSGDKRFIGKTNAEAAKFGLAPQLADGSFATLHHVGQKNIGPLIEASTRYHGIGTIGQNILHGQYGRNKPHPENPVDHTVWDSEKREYWKDRITKNE